MQAASDSLYFNDRVEELGEDEAFAEVFGILTDKQQEVLALLAENRTSREVAAAIGISESAVNQRLESVRVRLGYPARAKLARAYRAYLADRADPTPSMPQSAGSEALHPAEELERPSSSASTLAPPRRPAFAVLIAGVLVVVALLALGAAGAFGALL